MRHKAQHVPIIPRALWPGTSQRADGLGIHVEIFISLLTIPTFYKQLTILKIIWHRQTDWEHYVRDQPFRGA